MKLKMAIAYAELGWRFKEAEQRAKLALHVLQGKPLAYRLKLQGMTGGGMDTWVYECHFIGPAPTGDDPFKATNSWRSPYGRHDIT